MRSFEAGTEGMYARETSVGYGAGVGGAHAKSSAAENAIAARKRIFSKQARREFFCIKPPILKLFGRISSKQKETS